MKKLGTVLLFVSSFTAQAQVKDYAVQPVVFTSVHITDHFWKPKMEVNAEKTIPYILNRLKTEGRMDNFLAASGKREPKVCSQFPFDDTDVYKWIEGASYSLQNEPNPRLNLLMDSVIKIIGDAQEKDGYLFTFRSIHDPKPHDWIGAKRWEKVEDLSHELYNSGHLYEAAYAHFNATGKRSLLNIALKNADLLSNTFGYGKLELYPGHQIIEIGLVKLYRITHNIKYLDLAKFFLDVRGPGGNPYNQANKRVVDQQEAEGHAVRAAYMYSGMADIAAVTGDKKYLNAIDAIWHDVVYKKLYITGGIGATGSGEAFGEAYDLPNMSAYAETCAAIGNVYWNHRMFLLHGDSKYIDILERTLYNGLISGVSLDGTHFFYPNPLASSGQHERSPWFSCACCISNMTRFLPSIPGYVYAQNGNDLYVNLFVSNTSNIQLDGGKVNLSQTTNYPWDGNINLQINEAPKTAFNLRVRIPGWSQQQPVPGDLYFANKPLKPIIIKVNGQPFTYQIEKGYAVISRKWKKNDKVDFDLNMQPFKIFANNKVEANKGRFTIQNGPIIYCLEGMDNEDSLVQNILIDTSANLLVKFAPGFLNGINVITANGAGFKRTVNSKEIVGVPQLVTAIPYYSWNNRGLGEMAVWIPYLKESSIPLPAPTIANKSKVSASIRSRSLKFISDQYEPKSSNDATAPYFHWWPKKNTTEWVVYEFDQPQQVSSSRVYWFDDGPWGGCRIPASWKILYKAADGSWQPVKTTSAYELAKDKYNRVAFEPVTTTALKLEVRLPSDNATGVHEWEVN